MINIKSFATPKKSGGSGGGSSTTNITNNTIVNAESDKWFFFDSDSNSVGCKYDFYSVGAVSANGSDPEGSNVNIEIIDNCTSSDTDKALSANQGRVLKDLIDNIQTGGGGQALNTVDWSNVQNKPSTFTPSAHTHSMNDVTNLNSQLAFYSSSIAAVGQAFDAHEADGSIHLSSAQSTLLSNLSSIDLVKLAALLSLISVDTNAGTITVNGNIFASNDVTAQV